MVLHSSSVYTICNNMLLNSLKKANLQVLFKNIYQITPQCIISLSSINSLQEIIYRMAEIIAAAVVGFEGS